MYKLTVNISSARDDSFIDTASNYNGYYQLYTDNYTYIEDILNLLKLQFLKALAPCDSVYLCYCDTKNKIKCEYCYDDQGALRYHLNNNIEYFDLSKKDEYLFQIDIYESNQCGCEEQIRLKDFDTTFFDKYLESYNKKYTDYIPIFEHSHEIVENVPECYKKFIDYIMYNGKFIKYDAFIKQISNTKISIYNMVDSNPNFIINHFDSESNF